MKLIEKATLLSILAVIGVSAGCAFKEESAPATVLNPPAVPVESKSESPQGEIPQSGPPPSSEGTVSITWKNDGEDLVRVSRSLMSTAQTRTWKTDLPTTLPQNPPHQIVVNLTLKNQALPRRWLASLRPAGGESIALQVEALESIDLDSAQLRITDIADEVSQIHSKESFIVTIVGEKDGEALTFEIALRLPPLLLESIQEPLSEVHWSRVPETDRKRFFKSKKYPLVITQVIRFRNLSTEKVTLVLPTNLKQREVIALEGIYYFTEAAGPCKTIQKQNSGALSSGYMETLIPLDEQFGRRIAMASDVTVFPEVETFDLASDETLVVGIVAAAGHRLREHIRLKNYAASVPVALQLPIACEIQCTKMRTGEGEFFDFWRSVHSSTAQQLQYIADCRDCSQGHASRCTACMKAETENKYWRTYGFSSLFCAEMASQTGHDGLFHYRWIEVAVRGAFLSGDQDRGYFFKQNYNHKERNWAKVYFSADYLQNLKSYREFPVIQLRLPFNPNE